MPLNPRRLVPKGIRARARSRLEQRMGLHGKPDSSYPQIFSIGIFEGPSALALEPSSLATNPVLTGQSVTDADAVYVADPFMVRHGDQWFMFFESFDRRSGRADIALAESPDGISWDYRKIVLTEPFHLSYPQVFEWESSYYMIPETAETKTVRLYRAKRFPDQWELVETLLSGLQFADATVFQHDGRWWMFVETSGSMPFGTLRLFSSEELHRGWTEHPASPLTVDEPAGARPGGRVVGHDGGLLRFSQNCATDYGLHLAAHKITTLTPDTYTEHLVQDAPVLSGSGTGWNRAGMHHVDPHVLAGGQVIASVDGWFDPRE